MKKSFSIAVLSAILILAAFVSTYANNPQITFNGQPIEAEAIIKDGRTLLQARDITELLGGTINWNEELRQVTIIKNYINITLTIDSTYAAVNNELVLLDVPAQIIADRTMLPIRFVAENFGVYVSWHPDGIVAISTTTPPASNYLPEGFTEAVVERVIDGDTFMLTTGERVRFIGVDAPEIGEPGAAEATQFVRSKTLGQTVWLEADGNDTDSFGRLRRYVWLQVPTNPQDEAQIRAYQLNALLLEHGHATVMIIGNVRNEALFRQIETEQFGQPASQVTGSFIGNANSQIFHVPTCTSLPAPQNRTYFNAREDAIAAGHRPCGICNP